jgi:PAS domain S-box-containing protein
MVMSRRPEEANNNYRDVIADENVDDVLAAAVDVTVTLDADGTIQTVVDDNPQTLGYPPERLHGQPVTALLAGNAPPSPLFDVQEPKAFRRAILDDEADDLTVPVEAADGSVVALSISTVPRADTAGLLCVAQECNDTIADSHRQDEHLLDAVPDPVYVLDSAGRFERVNDALLEFTGYERAEIRGRKMTELLPTATDEQAQSGLPRLIDDEGGESATFETSFITKDGERMLAEANVTALSEDDGIDAGAVGVLRDIRERKHRERNLNMLKQVLTRVFRHNVRNELLIAKGHAELLEEEIDDDYQEHTAKILETADRLLNHSEKARLIERVIETETLYEINIAETVRDVVETARAKQPAATIDIDVPDEAVVSAHPDIDRAIEELVENAIEHAPDGGTAHVDIWLDGRDETQTLFVEDESGGLATNELNVLERGTENDLEHSSGVGLWLIRWLVEYSEAEMIVHRTGKGSVMGLRFGQQATETATDSPLTRAPAHVRDTSPERFRGDTVIGRVDALSRLETVYDALAQTGGHSVFLTGEAGIGKTTLVEQFRDWLTQREEQPVIATGFCDAENQPPYHAFRQVMDDLPTDHDTAAPLTEASADAVDDASELEQRKEALFADLADDLRAVAVDQPVVLVVEDMQWADRGTVDLFEYLVEEVGQWGHPVLFLGTYRTSDVDQTHPVLEIVDETATAGRGTVIELDPFDHDEVESLLAYMLDAEDVPASFVDAVHDHTGGTPLFVNELGRHLAETLGPVESGAALPDGLDRVSVPETVESAVTERLGALPDDVWPVLRLAAVIGREFSFDVLRAASDRSVESLIDCSNTLVRRQIWTTSADGIEFIHGVLREQTLDTISEDRDEALHRRVADAIETVHADELDGHAAQLGRHYEQVGEYDTAFEYYRRAGEYAADTYAQQAAIERYEQALALGERADDIDEETLADVCCELGNILRLVGEYDRARECYQQSLDRYQNAGNTGGEAESLNELGHIALRHGEYDQARAYYQQSLDISRTTGNGANEATTLTGLGVIEIHLGNYDDAREYHQQSLEIRQEIGDREGEADSFNNLGILADYRGNYDKAREYHQQSLEIRREIGDRKGVAASLGNLGIIARLNSEYDQAQEYHQESLDIREEIGDRKGQANCLDNLGTVAESRGEYDRAQEYHQQSLEIEQEIGDRRGEAASLDSLGTVAESRGEYDTAREYHQRSLDIEQELGDRKGEAGSRDELGTVAMRCGEYDQAREHFQESYDLFQELGDREGQARALEHLGALAGRSGDLHRADELLADALDTASEGAFLELKRSGLRERAAVARRRGEYDRAAASLEESLATVDDDENPVELARIRLERARLALARGDLETAREAVERGKETVAALATPHHTARATLLQGRIAAETGAPAQAREYYHDALETFEDIGASPDMLRTLRLLADTARQQGEDERVADYRERARTVAENVSEQVRANHEDWLDATGE